MALNINDIGLKFDSIIPEEEENVLAPSSKSKKADDKQKLKQEAAERKEEMRIAREMEKENKKAAKENKDMEIEVGIFGGITSQSRRAKISRYRSHPRFSKLLKDEGIKCDDKTINKMNEQQLEILEKRIAHCVCNRNHSNFYKGIVKTGLEVVENVGVATGKLKIQGLTEILNKSEDYDLLLDEIFIERSIAIYTKPEIRLAYLIGTSALKLHRANSAMAQMQMQTPQGPPAAKPQMKQPQEQQRPTEQQNGIQNIPGVVYLPEISPNPQQNEKRNIDAKFGDLLK
jgi:hypothetical protein